MYFTLMIILHTQCKKKTKKKRKKKEKENSGSHKIIKSFKEILKALIRWFKDNEMKLNHDYCQLVLNDSDIKTVNVGNFTCKNTKSKKLLGVTFYNKTYFQSQINNLCSRQVQKLQALARSTFFDLQFNYCPLAWVCHSRTISKKVNKLHKRCFKVNNIY